MRAEARGHPRSGPREDRPCQSGEDIGCVTAGFQAARHPPLGRGNGLERGGGESHRNRREHEGDLVEPEHIKEGLEV